MAFECQDLTREEWHCRVAMMDLPMAFDVANHDRRVVMARALVQAARAIGVARIALRRGIALVVSAHGSKSIRANVCTAHGIVDGASIDDDDGDCALDIASIIRVWAREDR